MERIKLAKEEKEALRILHEGKINMTTDPQRIGSLSYGFEALERLGLARCAWSEGHVIEDVAITSKGRRYVDYNPKLHNPIDWEKVAAIAAIISVIVAVIALFIACSAIKQNNS